MIIREWVKKDREGKEVKIGYSFEQVTAVGNWGSDLLRSSGRQEVASSKG